MKIRAPAKINLGLRILGRRADGYHLIDSIMAPVSLYDDIEIRRMDRGVKTKSARGPSIKVTCRPLSVPAGERNLAYRAANLLLRKAHSNRSVEIRIHKRIPVGAGLGGGSSDAAATLIGLNRLLKFGLSVRQLERLGLQLGADVPFFVRGRPARVRGIGERLEPLPRMRRCWFIILYPNFAVSTSWAYGNLPRKLTKPTVNTSITSSLKDFNNLVDMPLVNDLEAVTLRRFPRIRSLKESLSQAGAVGCLMSGSGSSVFGVFRSKRKAEKAFRRLRREEEAQAFLVHLLS